VELDFLYPSEGIHRRWDNGFRITATAATRDQAAFILSIPKRKPVDETQETLRTSAFPSQHVKVTWYSSLSKVPQTGVPFASNWLMCVQDKWAKNLYLASICYGRTVSWCLFSWLVLCRSYLYQALDVWLDGEFWRVMVVLILLTWLTDLINAEAHFCCVYRCRHDARNVWCGAQLYPLVHRPSE
jgi:hypothetical protein